MAQYTNYFTLYNELQDYGFETAAISIREDKVYSDEDLLASLEEILRCINTLDDYRTLIDILTGMRDQISLRFLYIFFQALGSVEQRVWATEGMTPPVKEIIEKNMDLLLDNYSEFVLRLETELAGWAKTNGYFDDDKTYAFICERNKIYSDYVILAGGIIDAFN